MQDLVDFYTEQSASNNFDNFVIKMGELSDSMENDLRVWWGSHSESEVEIPAEIVEKQQTVVNAYNGSSCTNPGWLLHSLMKPMEERFHFSDYSSTWGNAKTACSDLGMGFASVHDFDEKEYIKSQIQGKGSHWIGYHDTTGDHEYTWTDETCSSYINWQAGEPNNAGDEDCTQFYENGNWNDLNCNSQMRFVCRKMM
jgi:hypothetical protein